MKLHPPAVLILAGLAAGCGCGPQGTPPKTFGEYTGYVCHTKADANHLADLIAADDFVGIHKLMDDKVTKFVRSIHVRIVETDDKHVRLWSVNDNHEYWVVSTWVNLR